MRPTPVVPGIISVTRVNTFSSWLASSSVLMETMLAIFAFAASHFCTRKYASQEASDCVENLFVCLAECSGKMNGGQLIDQRNYD